MKPVMLTLAIGAVFILLGRWLYRNPTRLYPGWGLLNPENPGVKKVARAYATFAIFFGSLAISAVLLRGPFAVLLALLLAALGVWFLRPSPPQTAGTALPVDIPHGQEKKQRLLNARWKRNLPIILGVAVVFGIGVIELVGNSEVSKLAFAKAEADPTVEQRLGQPVKRGFFVSGKIETSGEAGRADLFIPISGPGGKGTVRAVALKSNGLWKFVTLQVVFKEGGGVVDLLKQAPPADQPLGGKFRTIPRCHASIMMIEFPISGALAPRGRGDEDYASPTGAIRGRGWKRPRLPCWKGNASREVSRLPPFLS